MDAANVIDRADADAAAPAVASRRIGPILLQPGVPPKEIFFYLVATMGLAFAVIFSNLMQPVILNDQLKIPTNQQGMLTGALATTQQLAVLLVIGFAGVMADKLGRRIVMMMAMTGFILCLLAYPMVTGILGLFAIRFAWGIASSAHTAGGATKMMDYPLESSRGKFISLITIVYAGVIALFNAFFGSRLASWYRDAGMSDGDATRWAFWTIALLAVGGLISTLLFMQDDRPPRPKVREKQPKGEIWRSWKAILQHARTDRRFAAVMVIASVIRTDGAVMMAFLGLWVVQAGRQGGIDPIEATKTIGLLLAVQNIASLCTAPIFGWLSDRIDRLRMLICSLVVMGLAFCSLGFIKDVFSPWMVLVVLVIGFAESAQSLTANALLGEAAPRELRGAAMGIFTWIGVASVLVINLAAGLLFDRLGPSAPFVMEGLLCLTIFGAVMVLLRSRPTA